VTRSKTYTFGTMIAACNFAKVVTIRVWHGNSVRVTLLETDRKKLEDDMQDLDETARALEVKEEGPWEDKPR
jgi:hypothetical protein